MTHYKIRNFAILISKVAQFSWPAAKTVYVTSGQVVVSIVESIPMQNCNREEVEDTMSVVLVLHALKQEEQTIFMCIVATDVVVILAGTFHDLVATQPLADIWLALGMGKNYRVYHFNAISGGLGSNNHERYLCSTHFHVVPQLSSMARARRRFGSPAGT